MTKINFLFISALVLAMFWSPEVQAGNPDRQGEAGAYELLINPYARSAGLNGLISSRVTGVESMRFNPAGIGRIKGHTELAIGHAQYLVGTGLSVSAAGIAQKIGDNSAFGVDIMSVSFGEIPMTTVNQPEGFATFKPSFFNIGLGYSYIFKDKEGNEKISVGLGVRVTSESIANATATGVTFDAGVQYVTGPKRQIKFGIALRNIGTKMKFSGDGLSFVGIAPNSTTALTVDQRPAGYEMPSLLHIGFSYDFLFPAEEVPTNRITATANFTANSFSRDQYGVGLEYGFREMFMARVGFKYESMMFDPAKSGTASAGLTGGVTVEIPFKKGAAQRIGFDYAYEYTRVFKGTHTMGLKLTL